MIKIRSTKKFQQIFYSQVAKDSKDLRLTTNVWYSQFVQNRKFKRFFARISQKSKRRRDKILDSVLLERGKTMSNYYADQLA